MKGDNEAKGHWKAWTALMEGEDPAAEDVELAHKKVDDRIQELAYRYIKGRSDDYVKETNRAMNRFVGPSGDCDLVFDYAGYFHHEARWLSSSSYHA